MKERPNFRNRIIWTGDNLDILRGINSGSVELIHLAGIHDGDAYPSMRR